MTGSSGWTPPGSDLPPGWSPRQPPPYLPGRVVPGDGRHGAFGPPYSPYAPYAPYAPAEPKPGIVPLRPLGLGEILDGAVSYIRQSPRAAIGLAAIVTTVSAGLQLAATFVMLGEVADFPLTGAVEVQELVQLLSGTLVAAVLSAVVGSVAQSVLTGMLTAVVGRAVLGRPTSIGHAWRDVRPRLLPLLGLAATLTLLAFIVVAIAATPVASLAAAGVDPVITVAAGVLLGVGALLVMIWLYVGFALATPALILERVGVFAALRRSWTLVRRGFWRILGILVLTGVIASVLGFILEMPFAIPQQLLLVTNPDVNAWPFKLGLIVATLGSIVAGTVVSPFSAGVRALLYVDQRIRREGLDIALHGATREPGASDDEAWSPWLTSTGPARQHQGPPRGPYHEPPMPPQPGGTPGW